MADPDGYKATCCMDIAQYRPLASQASRVLTKVFRLYTEVDTILRQLRPNGRLKQQAGTT